MTNEIEEQAEIYATETVDYLFPLNADGLNWVAQKYIKGKFWDELGELKYEAICRDIELSKRNKTIADLRLDIEKLEDFITEIQGQE